LKFAGVIGWGKAIMLKSTSYFFFFKSSYSLVKNMLLLFCFQLYWNSSIDEEQFQLPETGVENFSSFFQQMSEG